METDIIISEYCFNLFVKLNVVTCKLNPPHYNSLPGYSFDCFLKLSEVELDTIQDGQMLKDFIGAMRGGICGVMGNRKINKNGSRKFAGHDRRSIREPASQIVKHDQRSIWYIDANNLYGYALMQKLPYKDFSWAYELTLDEVLNAGDDSDYGYWLICNLEYSNSSKDKTSNFQLLPHRKK